MSLTGKFQATLVSIAFVLLTACSGGSSDPTVPAGDFTAYGVKGTVNGQNVTLDLSGLGNCATNIENMVIGINANGASISPDPRVARDYSQPVQFTLTAADGTKVVYTVTVKGAACVTAPPPPPPSTPDTTPPVITVLGTNPQSLTVGTAYTEAGATCVDNKDPSCTVVTTGTVNTAAAGSYTITYTATDAAGNVSTATRTVNVTTVYVANTIAFTNPSYSILEGDTITQLPTSNSQGVITWSSSNPALAPVASNGSVTATMGTLDNIIFTGTATITATQAAWTNPANGQVIQAGSASFTIIVSCNPDANINCG